MRSTARCKRHSMSLRLVRSRSIWKAVLRKYGFRDWDSVLAAIGHGGLKEGQVVNKLVEEYEKANKKEADR